MPPASEAGAVSAGAPAATCAALRRFGRNLGLAFQLVDDALDYSGASETLGKNPGDDFREGKATLPLLLAIARTGEAEKAFWERTIDRREQTEADFERARLLVSGCGALETTLALAEDYAADPLPMGVVLLTGGTDVQPNRLETEIVGWGSGEETWSVDFIVTYGNPDLDDVWALHDATVLNRVYTRADGVQLRVARCCVDTGGANTDAVYRAVRARLATGVLLGTKGVPGEGKPIIGNPSHSNLGKIPLFPVGTFTAKDLVMGRLNLTEPGPGFCHFPKRYRPEYFKGLTAEEVRVKYNKGFPVREFFKVYDRNEPLDCRVLAVAAFASLNVRIDELVEAMQAGMGGQQRRVRGSMEAA
jgi:phage terminase large subunit GpA-like protein